MWEAEFRRTTVRSQLRKKFMGHISTNVLARRHTFHPSYVGKHKYRNCRPGQPGHKVRPYLKNYQHKKDWQSGSSSRVPA
jgi:hypothetical protein